MKRALVLIMVACLFASVGVASDKPGQVDFKEFTLDNGLTVVVSEDHSVPVVAVDVWYHVGSAYEEMGRSGFAHLFEHMMFEGSENVGPTEHFHYISTAGGTMNGSTTQDRTNYWEILPANRLNLGLWLESDRMRSLVITEEKFENQRATVKEERRQGIDNQPYGATFLVSDTLSFDGWPYSHTVIGRMVDLDAANAEDAQHFFDRYYCPANAVLAIVGDVDTDKALDMAKKYFGDIKGGEPSHFPKWDEPFHTGERRQIVDAPKANVPAVFVGWKIPPHNSKDTPALSLLNDLLVKGESSRLHKRLVKDEEAAFAVFGFMDSRLGPGLFRVIVAANGGVEPAKCEELMYDEISRLQNEGISEDELNKVKVQFKSDFINGRQTVLNKAEALQHYALFHGDPNEINTDLDKYMAVTADDIQRVAKEYLTQDNRTAVTAMPPSS